MWFQVNAEHGVGGCEWVITHNSCTAWKSRRTPEFADWLPSVTACSCRNASDARADAAFRHSLRAEFERVVSDIRGRATCDLCWPDERSLTQLLASAAASRADDPYWADILGQVRGRVTVESGTARSSSGERPTYARARKRYMDTGLILDKEAMLACVTMEEPDLEKLGSEWEPKAKRPARKIVPGHPALHYAGWAFTGAAATFTGAYQFMAHPAILAALAAACIVAALMLNLNFRSRR